MTFMVTGVSIEGVFFVGYSNFCHSFLYHEEKYQYSLYLNSITEHEYSPNTKSF